MDDLEILLKPCLLPVKYVKLNNLTGNIDCIVCGTHKINVEDCLNSGINKLAITQQQIEINLSKINQMKLDSFNDYDTRVIDSFDTIKNTIDLRREMLKKEITNKIDDYCFEMIRKLELEEKKILENIKKMLDTDDLVDFNSKKEIVKNEKDILKKIQMTDDFMNQINQEIECIEDLVKDVTKGKYYSLKFKDLNLNLKETVGVLKLNEKFSSIGNKFVSKDPKAEHKNSIKPFDFSKFNTKNKNYNGVSTYVVDDSIKHESKLSSTNPFFTFGKPTEATQTPIFNFGKKIDLDDLLEPTSSTSIKKTPIAQSALSTKKVTSEVDKCKIENSGKTNPFQLGTTSSSLHNQIIKTSLISEPIKHLLPRTSDIFPNLLYQDEANLFGTLTSEKLTKFDGFSETHSKNAPRSFFKKTPGSNKIKDLFESYSKSSTNNSLKKTYETEPSTSDVSKEYTKAPLSISNDLEKVGVNAKDIRLQNFTDD
ncbi:unnamed protein product [Brachionus calyciflorus]|uniref:Uncharacterized protein n=1 Tax=Brachionus calyciflorus TaxID=104777 RepID=A0A813LXD8_9BILA|nr:unnamed protein product [Brachionus calyciflorus]